MWRVLRQRESALLVSGQTISSLGDGVANIALTFLVYDLTHHSATDLGLFAAARMAPMVAFLLVGGAIVDRFSRRTLLLISDAGRAVLVGAIVALAMLGTLHYSELIVLAVFFGAFDAVFAPAMSALMPEIVGDDELQAINAVRPLTSNVVGNMIGPALGAVIAAWSTSFALGLDAVSFVLSAAALAAMRTTPSPRRDTGTTMVHEIKEGLGYVRSTTWIWTTLVGVTLGNALIFTPTSFLLPYFILHTLHAARFYVGAVFAVSGAASIAGTILAGSIATPRRRIRVIWTAWGITPLTALILAFATNVWEVFLVPAIMMPCIIFGNVIWESMMQAEVPRELLGRVSSVDWFVSLGLAPVGLALAGAAVNAVGIRTYMVIAGVVCVVPGIVILTSARINAVDAHRVAPGSLEPAAAPPREQS